MLGQFIFEWFTATPAIVSIVGQRISETASAKGEKRPRIVHHLISSPVGRDLATRDDKRWSRVQFDCYGSTPLEAHTLADAIEALVDPDGGEGSLYPKTVESRTVYFARIEDRRGQFDIDAGNPTPAACIQLDVMFHHSWP